MSGRALLRRMPCLAGLALLGASSAACAPGSTSARPAAASATARKLTVEDLLAHPADVKVTLRPPAVAHDRVYGALIQKASALAAAYAGPPSLGTTTLAALERTDAIDAAMNDAGESVVVMRGVPADLEVERVVDEKGHPVWRPVVGDPRRAFTEYEPAAGGDVTLFVLPARVWVVAAGDARMHTREKLIDATAGAAFADGDPGLAVLTVRGTALVQRDPRLQHGSLAPLGHALQRASFELTPGALGVLVTRLEYAEAPAAQEAEATARDIVAAFRRILEQDAQRGKVDAQPPPLSWLAAAGIERASSVVTVRAPIPRRWLDAIAVAEVSEPALTRAAAPAPAATGTTKAPATHAPSARSAGAPKVDPAPAVPWDLWRRSAPAPLLLPDLDPRAGAQEPSQADPPL